MDISRAILDYLLPAAAVVWVIWRQCAGRFVPARRSLLLPVTLLLVGAAQAVDVRWTTLATAVVAGDVVLVSALGVARARATRLTLRDGYLYQRGGWPSVGLWVLTIAVRVGAALPFVDTSAGPALAATLVASMGVSLAVQFAVFNARVAADARPVRPTAGRSSGAPLGDRRGPLARSTLRR